MTTSSIDDAYSESVQDLLEDQSAYSPFQFDESLVEAAATGPTITTPIGDGTYTVAGTGTTLASGKWTSTTLPTEKVQVNSKGIYTADASTTVIDADSLQTYYAYRPQSNVRMTHWNVFSAFDASNATDTVTFYGTSNTDWHASTALGGTTASGTLEDPGKNALIGDTYVTYAYHNYYKGTDAGNLIYGGDNGDTLIGGNGSDTVYGGSGSDVIYGVGGSDTIYGGEGNDTIWGGTGDDVNDFIVTGTGNNEVILSSGTNTVIADQNAIEEGSGVTYANKIVAGSGQDTFVIGNIPASVTTTEYEDSSGEIATDASFAVADKLIHIGYEAMEMNPFVSLFTAGAMSVMEGLTGGKPSETVTTTSWSDYNVSDLYNFNPLEDRLLLPMSESGDTNMHFVYSTSGADDYDISVVDTNGGATTNSTVDENTSTNGWETILNIHYTDGKTIFGDWHSSSLSSDEVTAFNEAMTQNAFTMDESGVTMGNTSYDESDLSLTTTLSDEFGSGRYAMAGAWSGSFLNGGITSALEVGTNNNDVLFGYSITTGDDGIDPSGEKGHTYWGFGGSDIFGPGFDSNNTIIGGDDATGNTLDYQYYSFSQLAVLSADDPSASFGVEVDMSTVPESSDDYGYEGDFGSYYQVTKYGLGETYVDKVYEVANVIGSQGNDTLIGDGEDNTFYSTGGDNIWTGGDGADTFVLTGGAVTISDFNADDGDTLVVHSEDYSASSSDYEWDQGADGSWVLTDTATDAAVVTLSNDNYVDAAPDVTLYNDTTDTITTPTITTHYYDTVA